MSRRVQWEGEELKRVISTANFLYHCTSCATNKIAKHFDTNWSSIDKLIMSRTDWEAWEEKRKRGTDI